MRVQDGSSGSTKLKDPPPAFDKVMMQPIPPSGILRRLHIFSSQVDGSFWLLGSGQGDGEDDGEQLFESLNVLSICSSLMMSFWYSSVQYSSGVVSIVEGHFPGLGTALVACSFTCWSALIFSVVLTICLMFTIKSNFDHNASSFLISNYSLIVRLPYLSWLVSLEAMLASILLEVYIRVHGLDGEGVASDLGLTFWILIGIFVVFTACMLVALHFLVDGYQRSYRVGGGEKTQMAHESGKAVCPYFADLDGSALRECLDRYIQENGPGTHAFANPNPEQFERFVLSYAKSLGHSRLTYLTRKKIEGVFAEFVQASMAKDSIKVEKEDILEDVNIE